METKKRVGIWIRVSTDFQVDSESPEHHEQRGRYYAAAKEWDVIEIYRLDAISGKSVMDDPETKRMLKDLRAGHITGLIFSKLARVARNTKELLDFAEIFKKENGDLISLSENIDTSTPAGRLFYTMIAAMATWEREEIADRVAASVPIRAKMGKPLGGAASFGYKWQGKGLVIDEKEAPIRKLLYEIFIRNKRKKATASELNNLGHRTRNGSKFTDTTIERLLRDPTAKGTRKANYTRSTGEGKKWVVKNEKDWIFIPCPALIDEATWSECNDILDTQYKKRNKLGPRAVHLLSGYVICHCGRKMYVYHRSPIYACKGCKNKIAVDSIDEIYYAHLKSFLLTEIDLETYQVKSDSILQEKQSLLSSSQQQIETLRKKLNEYVSLRINKEMTAERFKGFYEPIEEQLAQLEKHLPELEADIDFIKIQYLSSDTVLRTAKDLNERWTKLPFEEKRGMVELLTNHVIIGKEDINIKLSYHPNTLSFQNDGNKQRHFMDSLKR